MEHWCCWETDELPARRALFGRTAPRKSIAHHIDSVTSQSETMPISRVQLVLSLPARLIHPYDGATDRPTGRHPRLASSDQASNRFPDDDHERHRIVRRGRAQRRGDYRDDFASNAGGVNLRDLNWCSSRLSKSPAPAARQQQQQWSVATTDADERHNLLGLDIVVNFLPRAGMKLHRLRD